MEQSPGDRPIGSYPSAIDQPPSYCPSVDRPIIDAVPDPHHGNTRKNASHPVIHKKWEAARERFPFDLFRPLIDAHHGQHA